MADDLRETPGLMDHPMWRRHVQMKALAKDKLLKFHKPWRDLLVFVRDVGMPPTPKHKLYRIENRKGFIPGNLVWRTEAEVASDRSDEDRGHSLYVRLSREQKDLIRAATLKAEAPSVTDWARDTLCTAAKRLLEKGHEVANGTRRRASIPPAQRAS